MDIRDIKFWMKEASIASLMKRAESYAASILPHRKAEDVNAELDKIKWEFYGLEHEEEIDKTEKAAKERLEKMKMRRKRKR